MVSLDTQPYIRTIEWEMIDKQRFIPLSLVSSFAIRSLLYPLTVIKTRLQVQHKNSVYSGTFDAMYKIRHTEGTSALYKGFWVSAFQLVSGLAYITTYETVRHCLQSLGVENTKLRALIGGSCASLIGQTIVVPFDVISQHLMVLGQRDLSGKQKSSTAPRVINPLNIEYVGVARHKMALEVINKLYRSNGISAFYRGYLASLCSYVPNSAIWWSSYHYYQERLDHSLRPSTCPLILLQCLSAMLGGVTSAILTNPLDCVRARYQVQRSGTLAHTVRSLWREEGWAVFGKGLSARLFSSLIFSSLIVLGYESVKRASVTEHYREHVRW